jgi:hypothetical protein
VDLRFMKRLLILMFCYFCVLVLLVGAWVARVLSLDGLIEIAIPLSTVGMFFVLLRFSQKAKAARAAGLSPTDVPTRQQAVRSAYVCGATTIMFILCAIGGFPDLKTVPILEQVVLVGLSLTFIATSGWAFYVSLRRLKGSEFSGGAGGLK